MVAALLAGGLAHAQEKKEAARLTAMAPLEAVPGAELALKFRGLKLDGVAEVRFPSRPELKAVVKEKKKADLPNGLEAKVVGDTQCEAAVTLPADLPPGPLAVAVVTPEGVLKAELRILAAEALADEKEPNNGFREAQMLSPGKCLRGSIREDKDVDVFAFAARKGQRMAIEVLAGRATSLLDPLVTVYDEAGRALQIVDDTQGRDPVLVFMAPADGRFLVAVQDAGDRGGPWHPYQLTVKEVVP